MAQFDLKRRLAGLSVVVFGGWEAFHWLNDITDRDPWTFGLGFATASVIFGFWGSSGTAGTIEAARRPLEHAPGIEELDALLKDLINEGQETSEREKKAAERIARYDEA
jgi:hypothetical protein